MRIFRIIILVIGIFILREERAIAQIPVRGYDFPTLAHLQWDMTIQAARNSLSGKREILDITSSKLSYEDTLLNAKAKITLKFIEKDSRLILKSIDTKLENPNEKLLQSIEKYLTSRYGNKYESKKESQTKFFFTADFNCKIWQFDKERVALMFVSQGKNIMGINILYSKSDDSKR